MPDTLAVIISVKQDGSPEPFRSQLLKNGTVDEEPSKLYATPNGKFFRLQTWSAAPAKRSQVQRRSLASTVGGRQRAPHAELHLTGVPPFDVKETFKQAVG
jgi:hypothetical protein